MEPAVATQGSWSLMGSTDGHAPVAELPSARCSSAAVELPIALGASDTERSDAALRQLRLRRYQQLGARVHEGGIRDVVGLSDQVGE
jgi:hypothetical protein